MIKIESKNPTLNYNDGSTLVAIKALECGEIDPNHVIVKVVKRPAGITEVLTKAKGQRNPNMFYRFLIDSYTGVNLNGRGMGASWLKEGLEGPTHGGQVSIESDNAAAAALRLIEAGFSQGYLLRIHNVGWSIKDNKDLPEGDQWKVNRSRNRDFDFRVK